MKAIGILGTSSNAGKSWFATALCAWLHRQGVRVAPFKAQNMSNNAYATLDGGEIGVAQAVQAAACGLTPTVEMNPILLKPCGNSQAQIIRLGQAVDQIAAKDYYQSTEASWQVVRETLDGWQSRCDVLIMEGAGSPVELNIAQRDIANLRPIRYANGKWILVADIERGGVFAQIAGTWMLCSPEDQARGLGYVINKFCGDPSFFHDPHKYLGAHCPMPYLGLLTNESSLQIDEEDSLCLHHPSRSSSDKSIAWVRLPHISNSQDIQAWRNDQGVNVHWATRPEDLQQAAAIIIPGTKNTLYDLEWLRQNGLADAILQLAKEGIPIVGICGGYQMLGTELNDPNGVAGQKGQAQGLGLIHMRTDFLPHKTVAARQAHWNGETWDSYEIHSGQSTFAAGLTPLPLLKLITADGTRSSEGISQQNIWGSYQHGLFDAAVMRRRLVDAAGIKEVTISSISRKAQAQQTFEAMADLLEARLDLDPIRREVGI